MKKEALRNIGIILIIIVVLILLGYAFVKFSGKFTGKTVEGEDETAGPELEPEIPTIDEIPQEEPTDTSMQDQTQTTDTETQETPHEQQAEQPPEEAIAGPEPNPEMPGITGGAISGNREFSFQKASIILSFIIIILLVIIIINQRKMHNLARRR